MATKEEEEEKAKRDLLNSDTPEGKAARAERAAVRAATAGYGAPNRGQSVEQYGRVTYPDDPAKQKPAQPQGTPSQGADASESVQRTVRDVAKEGITGATKTVGDVALEGVKTASRMKSGAEQYVGGQLRKGAGALVDKASEMNPLDAMGAAAKVANQASNPIGAIANAIGDIEVGGGGADQPAITNEPNEFDKAEDFLKQARGRDRGMSEEVANVMADIDMARAETGLGRESEDSPEAPAAPEGANDFLAAQEDFNEKYGDGPSLGRPEEGETADQYEGRLRARNAARKALAELKPKDEAPDAYSAAKGEFNEKFGGSMGRAMEGETADQYDARLKQRNVDRKEALGELAKLKPQGGAPATPDERVADTGGKPTGVGFDDQATDPDAGGFKAPTISPQASSSARDTASKPSKGNTSQPRPKRKLGEIRGNQFGAKRENKRDRQNQFGAIREDKRDRRNRFGA